jgi:hypothetical protein
MQTAHAKGQTGSASKKTLIFKWPGRFNRKKTHVKPLLNSAALKLEPKKEQRMHSLRWRSFDSRSVKSLDARSSSNKMKKSELQGKPGKMPNA